jgi:hypothetical protein
MPDFLMQLTDRKSDRAWWWCVAAIGTIAAIATVSAGTTLTCSPNPTDLDCALRIELLAMVVAIFAPVRRLRTR